MPLPVLYSHLYDPSKFTSCSCSRMGTGSVVADSCGAASVHATSATKQICANEEKYDGWGSVFAVHREVISFWVER